MNEPIRVLHIVTHMNRGGLETMIMNYYRHIDRTKIQFDFLTHRSEKKDYDDEIESLGGKIYHLPPLNPFSLDYRKALKKFFNEHKKYKIVHSHLDCMSSIPLRYAKEAGIKNRIAHSHNTNQEKNIKYLIKLFYKNKINKYATKLYACGIDAGRWMYSGKDFDVLANAIDADEFSYNEERRISIRKELNLNDQIVFGHVGRFNVQKNHELLIDIFNEIHQLRNDSILLLVGEGELQQQIQEKVNSLNLTDSVIFLGLRSDISNLLNAMDCFLFPSKFEGLPVSIIEAQASGLLCVKSDKVPNECIVTDDVVTIPLDLSAKQWAQYIIDELNTFVRKDTRHKIIENGFDIKSNVKELENLYLEMYSDE